MTHKSSPVKVKWTQKSVKAFEDLRNCLCWEPDLQCPDFCLPFMVHTDASGVGLGAGLLQGEDRNQFPVKYISQKLLKWGTQLKRRLWLLNGLWTPWDIGKEFILDTDHHALHWIYNMKDTNTRITRWYLSLQPYQFQIGYRPGHKNVIADFLSRDSEEWGDMYIINVFKRKRVKMSRST